MGRRELFRDGSRSKVIVDLGKPRRSEKGDWECPFRIRGFGVQYGYGVDAIQALTTALEGIRVTLERSEQKLSWVGGEPGYTGFDRFVTTPFGVRFTKRLNGIIDQEINRFVSVLEKKHQQNVKQKTRIRKSGTDLF